MEVEFSLTRDDFKAFAEFHRRNKLTPGKAPTIHQRARSKPSPTTQLVGTFVGFVLGLWVLSLFLPGLNVFRDPGNYVLAFAIGAGFSFICLLLLIIVVTKRILRGQEELFTDERNRWKLGPRRLWISPEGVHAASECHRGFSAWSIIWLIGTTEDHLFLYNSTREAYVIPRGAFANQGDSEAFLALAQRYRDQFPPAESGRPTGITTIPNVLPVHDFQCETPDPPL